jgi:predicted phosphodiesterase
LRVALFSDVHGNGVAFRAMLDDLSRQDYDRIVCLGDHAQGGPEPAECLELLRELGCPAVYGNSDHFLLTLDFGEEEVTEAQVENAKWAQSQLSDVLLQFHRSFAPTVEVDLDGRKLLAFHATPRSREELVGPWMEEEQFRAPFEGLDGVLFAGGHSHQQWARRLGDAYYINPGSVGLAYDHLRVEQGHGADPSAEYAIVAIDDSLAVEWRRIPVDREAVIRSIEQSGMPHQERTVQLWRGLPT